MSPIHSVIVRSLSKWLLTLVAGVPPVRGRAVGVSTLVLVVKGEGVCGGPFCLRGVEQPECIGGGEAKGPSSAGGGEGPRFVVLFGLSGHRQGPRVLKKATTLAKMDIML